MSEGCAMRPSGLMASNCFSISPPTPITPLAECTAISWPAVHCRRPSGGRNAALTLRADLPHLAMEDEGVLDLAERLLDRLQILCGRLLLACLEALDRIAGPPRREEGNGHSGTDRPKP